MPGLLILFVCWLVLALPRDVAAQFSIPNNFQANTTIRSAEVNANFSQLTNALNRGGGEITGNIAVAPGVTIDGRDLSTIPTGRYGVNTQTGNFTLNYSDASPSQLVVVNNTSAATVTLYESTSSTAGAIVTVKVGSAAQNTVTIAAYSGQSIDGASTAVMTARNQSLTLVSLGASGWVII